MLVLLYLMAYLDKTNIGNAKIEGLLESLGMDGVQYNVALSIFFIPFVLAEVPSNMVLHLFKRPSLYIWLHCLLLGSGHDSPRCRAELRGAGRNPFLPRSV